MAPLLALFAVIAFTFSAIPLGMVCHRVRCGTWRDYWSS